MRYLSTDYLVCVSSVLKNIFIICSGGQFIENVMPRIPANLRERAIGPFQAGTGTAEVARVVGASVRAVRHLMNRFRQTGTVADRPRSGRPRVTTRAQDKHIVLTHLRDRFLPATSTAAITPGAHNNRISDQTVSNRLRTQGIRSHRPYVGCFLSDRHRWNHLNWTRRHQRWTRRQWNTVLFLDDSRFTLTRSDGRVRVYRRRMPTVVCWSGIVLVVGHL